jgi:ParB-like chromosome segregation protein Spo0J
LPVEYSLIELPPQRIRWEDVRFTFSFPQRVEPLERSLARTGMRQPPVVKEEAGGFTVVCGYRRALAARALGWQGIPCLQIPPPGPDDAELFSWNLEENAASRALNLVEKAGAIRRIVLDFAFLEGGPARRTCFDLLHTTDAPVQVRRHLAVDALPVEVKNLLVERGFPETSADVFLRLAPGDAVVLAGLAERLRLTAS